jgi:hypothetical protein
VLIAISDAATGKLLQTISLPERVIDHPFAESPESGPQQSHTTQRSY